MNGKRALSVFICISYVCQVFIKMQIRCISLKLPEATFYKPAPTSELVFWLRNLASGLRPSVCQMLTEMHIRCIGLKLPV